MRRRPRMPVDFVVDVTPVMSVIVHLIPMLLLAVRFERLAQHATDTPPAELSAGPAPAAPVGDDARPVVRITHQGFVVRGAGLPDSKLACSGSCDPADYDYDGLGRLLADAKALHPDNAAVVLIPEADVPYDVVARTFAASATRAGRTLFPEPLIVTGAGEGP